MVKIRTLDEIIQDDPVKVRRFSRILVEYETWAKRISQDTLKDEL